MTELIVFDLDGTLVDSMRDITGAVNHMLESFGLGTLSHEEIAAMTGDGPVSLVTRALKGADVSIEEAVRRQREFYSKHCADATTLYPGVREGLAAMKEQNIRLAVITNKQSFIAVDILKALDAACFFDEIWGFGSGFALKPDPAGLLAFRDQCGAKKENCWILGDHCTDLGAGRQAGFRKAFARWGYGVTGNETFDREFFSFAEFTAAVTDVKG